MLSPRNPGLIYPRLFYTKHQQKNSTVPLYGLDWSKKEYRFHEGPNSSCDTTFVTGLPEPFETIVSSMVFALNEAYITEIDHSFHMSNIEWTRRRPFDTMIREMCLESAITYIWIGFKLLADCLHNPEMERFDRSPLKIIAPYALAYKFWRNQTGDGLVSHHARIDQLKNLRDSIYLNSDLLTNTKKEISNFLDAVENHERLIYNTRDTVFVGESCQSEGLSCDETDKTD